MKALIRKYSLFYLVHSGTFFLLCAYSLAADAPNFPFLPPLFFPIYLSSAVAISERETGDPMLGILPVTPGEIIKVKFILAFFFVVIGWLNMTLFTVVQGLDPVMTTQVMKLNLLGSLFTLLLAAGFQLGLQFFGWRAFHKVIVLTTATTAVFCIIFFVGLAKMGLSGRGGFPLIPALDRMPPLFLVVFSAGVLAIYYWLFRLGSEETLSDGNSKHDPSDHVEVMR